MTDSDLVVEQPSPTKPKLPIYFWIVAIVGLLWNLMGLSAFIGEVSMSQEAFDALPESTRELSQMAPKWLNAFFGIATITGVLGCIALMIRFRSCVMLFLVSLLCAAVQIGFSWFGTDAFSLMEKYKDSDELAGLQFQIMYLPATVIILAVVLLAFGFFAKKKGFLC